MEVSQEDACELREEIKNKEYDANMLRMEMKREWETAIDSRQGGAKGGVNDRIEELRDLVKHQQQHVGISMSKSMLMFKDELIRVHHEFDRRDQDQLKRIRYLETMVTEMHDALKRTGGGPQVTAA